MPIARTLAFLFLFLQNPDFGEKFLDDLQKLFGRLEVSELDHAFREAKPIRCSDLIGRTGEWKNVGFLNDNRNLAAWHHEDIDSVKNDPVRYVFSGMCTNEQAPLRLATRYPVKESYDQFRKGSIPFSKVALRDNPPVSVVFDRPTNSYTFQLPFLYAEGATRAETTYTFTPPTAGSRVEAGFAAEFRCKAINDNDLTYRFLLCRTAFVNLNAANPKERIPNSPNSWAYYIFSDGREASSTVNLSFKDMSTAPKTPEPQSDAPTPTPAHSADAQWEAVQPQSRLIDVGDREFRLRFDPAIWTARIGKPQMIENRTVSPFTVGSTPTRTRDNCVWQPVASTQTNNLLAGIDGETLFTLGFQKRASSGMSVSFDVDGTNGRIGSLQCYFPQSQTPADVTVRQWNSIVGANIAIEVRRIDPTQVK